MIQRSFIPALVVTLAGCSSNTSNDAAGDTATGSARFALSASEGGNNYRFIGSLDILRGGNVEDTLIADAESPATHTHTLPIGGYSLGLVGADFGDLLTALGAPFCEYNGANANLFVG